MDAEAIGTLAVGGRPFERGSLFRIASTTKPMTAAPTLGTGTPAVLWKEDPQAANARDVPGQGTGTGQ